MKIAISGKGGVGKTTIAGTIARYLLERGVKVLAIDADSNPNLALTLGMSPEDLKKIIPLAENQKLIEEKTGVKPSLGGALFRLSFRVDDIIDRFSVKTPSGISIIIMGAVKSSGQGCMCPANALIRAILRHLITKRDEAVIVDMEAGIEHFGRGTAEYVDIILIVTEANVKSLETVRRIYKLSQDRGIKTAFVIGNKIVDYIDEKNVRDFCKINEIPVLGFVSHDESIRQSDAQGTMFNIHSKSLLNIQQFCDKLVDTSIKPR